MLQQSRKSPPSAFSMWIRTGYVPRSERQDGYELKFNPWHDPADGRFTSAGSGAGSTSKSGIPYSGAHRRAPSNPVVEFAAGLGAGLGDVAKDTASGVRTILTTSPRKTINDTMLGVAERIDTAIAAEDTPARIQIARAADRVAHASARDIGHATGSVIGNTALTVAPGTAAARLSRLRYLRTLRPRPTYPPLEVRWVKETLKPGEPSTIYNDGATGARPGQAPALMRTLPNGRKRPVKFDGIEGDYVIDRKTSIWTTQSSIGQLKRQSEVLAQHHAIGTWEVPNLYEKKKALKLFKKHNIRNIKVRIVEL